MIEDFVLINTTQSRIPPHDPSNSSARYQNNSVLEETMIAAYKEEIRNSSKYTQNPVDLTAIAFKQINQAYVSAFSTLQFEYVRANYDGLRKQMLSLLIQEEYDEDGDRSRPTDYAFDYANNILNDLMIIYKRDIPKVALTVSETGGLRIQWRDCKRQRELRLIIPSNKNDLSYIYLQEDNYYNIFRSPNFS